MTGYDFQARAVRLGMATLLAGVVANFIPALYLSFVLGVSPPPGDMLRIWFMALTAFGASWLVQPLSFYPMLGIGGSYISWLCGNVADIRIPAATMAQKVAGVEPGTPKGDVLATLGIAGSVLVSVTILTVFTFIGAAVVPLLPKFVVKAFGFIIPAVFGAVYAELASKQIKIGLATIAVALLLTLTLPKMGVPEWLLSILVITGGVLVARVQYALKK